MDAEPDRLTDDLKDMLAPSRRKQLAIDIAIEEIVEAESRIDALAEERRVLHAWQRSKRKDIDKLVALQRDSIERWNAERASRNAERERRQAPPPAAIAHEPAVSIDEVRVGMAARAAHLTERIGQRPDTLSEREQWCHTAASLLSRPIVPSRTLEVDAMADLRPEL